MGEEVQERVEDCLELDQYIEQLRLQRSARLPANLAPQQTRIYSMALFFHTASSHAVDLRPEFSTQLQQRLLEQVRAEEQLQGTGQPQGISRSEGPVPTLTAPVQAPTASVPPPTVPAKGNLRTIFRKKQVDQPAQISSTSSEGRSEGRDVKKQQRRAMTRRILFTSGTMAAGVAIGGGIESFLEHQSDQNPTIAGKTWVPVTTLDQLGNDPMHFATNTITGYLIRQTENGKPTEQVRAFSAACTHLGCTVQWKGNEGYFQCPCHGITFDTSGKTTSRYKPLPILETNIGKNGTIYVKVP